MTEYLRGSGMTGLSLLALTVGGALPAAAQAGRLGYRNDTNGPVIVQGASIVNQVIRRGKPHLLHPSQAAWDGILQPGNKIITVYDARQPGRILYQGPLVSTGPDQFFSIQIDPTSATLAGQPPYPARAKLVPAQLLPAPPGGVPAVTTSR